MHARVPVKKIIVKWLVFGDDRISGFSKLYQKKWIFVSNFVKVLKKKSILKITF